MGFIQIVKGMLGFVLSVTLLLQLAHLINELVHLLKEASTNSELIKIASVISCLFSEQSKNL